MKTGEKILIIGGALIALFEVVFGAGFFVEFLGAIVAVVGALFVI